MTRTMDDMFLELFKEEKIMKELASKEKASQKPDKTNMDSLIVNHQNVHRLMDEIEERKEEIKADC